jgi:hypothetical protein
VPDESRVGKFQRFLSLLQNSGKIHRLGEGTGGEEGDSPGGIKLLYKRALPYRIFKETPTDENFYTNLKGR